MHSSLSVEVMAPARRVFDLARQVPRWPELLSHYRAVTVQSRDGERITARMVAERRFGPLPVPVFWRAEHWPDDSDADDLRLHFRHVGALTRGMRVSWHIRPAGERACTVRIEHEFERPLPLLGPEFLPRLVNRLFIRPIAGRTLATFKTLAEQAA